MLAYKDGKRVRVLSRTGVDHSRRFPEIVAAVASLRSQTLVLDGEVAIFYRQRRSRFDWLRDPDPEAVATPPLLIVFDMLYRSGRDLTQRPLRDRRARLEELLAGADRILPVRRLASNGLAAWAQVLEKGYEGMVAKDEASAYVAGRTRHWLKVKVPGWTDSGGSLEACTAILTRYAGTLFTVLTSGAVERCEATPRTFRGRDGSP
jgi:bifunctional non-homologous end joining protein LigD